MCTMLIKIANFSPIVSLVFLIIICFIVWPCMNIQGDVFMYISFIMFVFGAIIIESPFRVLIAKKKRHADAAYFIFVIFFNILLFAALAYLKLFRDMSMGINIGLFSVCFSDIFAVVYIIITFVRSLLK